MMDDEIEYVTEAFLMRLVAAALGSDCKTALQAGSQK
jgi:hypothetical protein